MTVALSLLKTRFYNEIMILYTACLICAYNISMDDSVHVLFRRLFG